MNLVAVCLGVSRQRNLARPAQHPRHCALGRDACKRYGTRQGTKPLAHIVAVVTDLDAQSALPGSRQTLVWLEIATDSLAQAQAFQAGSRQDNRVIVAAIQLTQASIEITA